MAEDSDGAFRGLRDGLWRANVGLQRHNEHQCKHEKICPGSSVPGFNEHIRLRLRRKAQCPDQRLYTF